MKKKELKLRIKLLERWVWSVISLLLLCVFMAIFIIGGMYIAEMYKVVK